MTAEVQEKLDITLPGPYEQVMYIVEKCYVGCGYAAYAYPFHWMSVYQVRLFDRPFRAARALDTPPD